MENTGAATITSITIFGSDLSLNFLPSTLASYVYVQNTWFTCHVLITFLQEMEINADELANEIIEEEAFAAKKKEDDQQQIQTSDENKQKEQAVRHQEQKNTQKETQEVSMK